jgi:hypothetical protein
MQDRSPPTRRNLLATHGRTIHLGHYLSLGDVHPMSALPPKDGVIPERVRDEGLQGLERWGIFLGAQPVPHCSTATRHRKSVQLQAVDHRLDLPLDENSIGSRLRGLIEGCPM